jgi:hypothetical protein
MEPSDLSQAELSLWQAFPAGAWVDLHGDGGQHRPDPLDAACWPEDLVIRAEVISALLLGAAEPRPGKCPGLRLRGARVAGRLDLTGAAIGCSLICEDCRFEAAPRFTEAIARTICISGSWLPGFSGARMRIEGMLSLSGSTIAEVVLIDRARITGEVCLRGAEVGDGSGRVAVAAGGLAVDGNLDCAKITCHGALKLQGARITGQVDVPAPRLTARGRGQWMPTTWWSAATSKALACALTGSSC